MSYSLSCGLLDDEGVEHCEHLRVLDEALWREGFWGRFVGPGFRAETRVLARLPCQISNGACARHICL